MTVLAPLHARLGTAGLAGLLLLAGAAAWQLAVLRPAEQALAQHSAALPRPAAQSPASAPAPAPAPLERFYAELPALPALTGEMEKLLSHARSSGAMPQRGEYRLEPQGPMLMAYRVRLPVRATYPALRRFIDQVLADMPAASLDALRMERRLPQEEELQAELRFTLHFQRTGKPGEV